ncbi:FecR family protein [Maribacter sp.]|uniref:FecR family protein n=1 Tax=Maribacter sp. TaxID=1897614 RepID=UPI0025BDB308|nr:FecR family protein [Maribacter sp.]
MNQEGKYLKIAKLIASELNKSINEEDQQSLDNWLDESIENKRIYDEIKRDTWYQSNLRSNQEYGTEEGWNEVNSRIKSTSKVIKLTPSIWKYAAAAVIVFGLGYFFRNNIFNIPIETTPTIVNTNSIVPGIDKATLTLGDGSQITLEKGEFFKTQNANSNGEKIVYQSGKSNSKKIVYNYLTIPRGGQFFIKLSDGTQVWLNSESQLKYPESFIEGKTRQIELVYGEAYFDVSSSVDNQGSKFRVINNAQNVEVLGTEFNIKAYKDEANIYTTLVEGKVIVNALNKSKSLIPNEELNFNKSNNSLIVSSGVDVYKAISWKEGIFSFRDKPLQDIMKVLSRWYDIEVVFKSEDIKRQTFHGSLDKKLSIEEIISIICTTNNIEYELNNRTVLLK